MNGYKRAASHPSAHVHASSQHPKCLLPPPLPAGLLPAPCGCDIVQGENTPVQALAWHDGMVIFNGALRKAIPPNATTASPDAAVPCACSDAAPRDTSSSTPPFLVTTDCFFQAQYGSCNASFMQVRGLTRWAGLAPPLQHTLDLHACLPGRLALHPGSSVEIGSQRRI